MRGLRANPLRRFQREQNANGSGGSVPCDPGAADALTAEIPVTGAPALTSQAEAMIDLSRRREQLSARVAELQWDLGGLVYEMAIRDHIRVDVLARRAAILQGVDGELGEVERILRMEQTGTAGSCPACGAPHSSGAVYCWQCGQSLLQQVSSHSIGS